jgi:hypothetical protein
MVDVQASHLDPSEGADVVGDAGDEQAHGEKGDEETYRGEKKATMRTVGYLLMDEMPELRQVQHQEDKCNAQGYEDKENPRSGDMHVDRMRRENNQEQEQKRKATPPPSAKMRAEGGHAVIHRVFI